MASLSRCLILGAVLLCLHPALTTAADRTPVDGDTLPAVPRTLAQVESPFAVTSLWNIGDVFVGVAGGQYYHYDNTGHLADILNTGLGGYTTGGAFDKAGNLYSTAFSGNRTVVFSATDPHTIVKTIDTGAHGGTNPEDVVFAANGDFYVTNVGGNGNIQRYNAAGVFQQNYGTVRSDWMDLATDQSTMFYTTESPNIARWNLSTNSAMSDFANIGGTTFAFRLLPPGDGSGGLIAAHLSNIVRLDGSGNVVQTYDAPGQDSWFSLNLDPNGTSFWAGDFTSGNFYRFNIATGAVEVGPINTGTGPQSLYGIIVNGEITQALCSASVAPPSYSTTAVPGDGYGLNFSVTTRQSCLGIHQLSLQAAPPYSNWLFDVEPPVATNVGPNQTTTFTVTFVVPLGTPSGEYAFALRAVGDGDFLGFSSIDLTVPSQTFISDLDFRPDPNGFSFQNPNTQATWPMFQQFYGTTNVQYSNGDHIPAAQMVFDSTYSRMGMGGSCNGFSTASMLGYQSIQQPNAGSYAMPHVPQLFSEISFPMYSGAVSYYQAAQISVNIARTRALSLNQSPKDVYAGIKHALGNGSSGVIGIFHTQGKTSAGHAILPYRMVESAHGADVYVYDCNHPGDSGRKVTFDFDANTWSYAFDDPWFFFFCLDQLGCTWTGDASSHNISFEPLSLYVDQGVPSWEAVQGQLGTTLLAVAGEGSTLIGDGTGHFVGSGAVGQPAIPDAVGLLPLVGWNPIQPFEAYYLPEGAQYSIEYVGSAGGVDVSSVEPGMLDRVRMPSSHGIGGKLFGGGAGLGFRPADSSMCIATVARSAGDQGRVAEWTFPSLGKLSWSVSADSTGSVLALADSSGSTTYDVAVQTLGPGKSRRVLSGLAIYNGETHSVALGDWSALGTRDVVVDVSLNGVPARRLVATSADLDIEPNTLNGGSHGKYVAAYCQLRSPWQSASYISSSFRLGTLTPVGPTTVGDANGDGIPDLMLKFDRAAVLQAVGSASTWIAELTGKCALNRDTVYLSARDTIRIIRPQVVRPRTGDVLGCASSYVVAWTVPSDLSADAVDLVFSSDHGNTWTPIVRGLTSDTTFAWQTPTTATDSALVGVEAYRSGQFISRGVSGYFRLQSATNVGTGPGGGTVVLAQPIPTPFSRKVTISYDLPQTGDVHLSVFNVSGRRVRTLASGSANAGTHVIVWDGTDDRGSAVSAGVYLLRLEAGGAVRTRKIVSIR